MLALFEEMIRLLVSNRVRSSERRPPRGCTDLTFAIRIPSLFLRFDSFDESSGQNFASGYLHLSELSKVELLDLFLVADP